MKISPLNIRRLNNFKSNKRGWYSFWIFIFLFLISIFADVIANDNPLVIKFDNDYFFPIFTEYPETIFGGDFETEADYRDPYVKKLIEDKGWIIMPIIPYTYNTIIRDLELPAPAPPSIPPRGRRDAVPTCSGSVRRCAGCRQRRGYRPVRFLEE